MIKRKDMLEPLLDALPAFRPIREEFVEKWTGNANNHFDAPGDLPEYLLLGDLGRWLLCRLGSDDIGSVQRAFAVVDRWLLEGDPYVQEATTIGFIETLQNKIEDDETRQRVFDLFGPEGQLWWKNLEGV